MKIRKKSLLVMTIVITLLASIKFFYQISFNKLLVLFCVIISFVLGLLVCPKEMGTIKREAKFINFYSSTALVSLFIVFGYSVLMYGAQGVRGTLYASYSYFTLLFVYPVLCWIISDGEEHVFGILNIISFIWCMLIVAQSILYPFNGQIIIPEYFYDNVIMRDGTIRVSLTWVGNLMILYNFYRFYFRDKMKWKMAFFEFLIGLYGLVFIQKTRMYLITLFIGIILMVWLDRGNINKRLKKVCFFFCVAGIVYASGIIDSLLGSFSMVGKEAGSTIARLNGMEYFWGIFMNNPLFGHGFVNDAFYPAIVRGPLGIAYYDDLGFVAQLARTGLFIVFIYVIPVLHMTKIAWRMRKAADRNKFALYVGFVIYIILTSGSLILLDAQRCIAMPMMVALFEYQNIEMNRKLKSIY